jgi:hypothetical protein
VYALWIILSGSEQLIPVLNVFGLFLFSNYCWQKKTITHRWVSWTSCYLLSELKCVVPGCSKFV